MTLLLASFEDFFDVSLDLAVEAAYHDELSISQLMGRFIQTERLIDKVSEYYSWSSLYM